MEDREKKLEEEMSEALTEGEMEAEPSKKAAARLISPKYEIRQTVQWDPIIEETLQFRSMAREVDDRYDRYLSRAKRRLSKSGTKDEK